jgi:broad specificity phosphatase PhoE
MSTFPEIFLVRHGETAWTISRQHTGLTDLPLTPRGEDDARQLGQHIPKKNFAVVMTSPLQRAKRTCDLAGFGATAVVDSDLVEWDYGDFEGKTTAEIRTLQPNWSVFRDGCPGGESIEQVTARADRVINKVRQLAVHVLIFSSGHFTRVLAARWLGQPTSFGQHLLLGTASLSVLGYDHGLDEPVIRLWNERRSA